MTLCNPLLTVTRVATVKRQLELAYRLSILAKNHFTSAGVVYTVRDMFKQLNANMMRGENPAERQR